MIEALILYAHGEVGDCKPRWAAVSPPTMVWQELPLPSKDSYFKAFGGPKTLLYKAVGLV